MECRGIWLDLRKKRNQGKYPLSKTEVEGDKGRNPNSYEDSLCQETNSPSERVGAFSAFQGLAQAAVGRVF